MRQSEFKLKFDPEIGRFTKQHIWSGARKRSVYGEGIKSAFKSIGTKVLGKKSKKKSIDKTLVARAAEIVKEQRGKKAGDKIVKMLTKEAAPSKAARPSPAKKVTFGSPIHRVKTRQERNNTVNQIMSVGRKII